MMDMQSHKLNEKSVQGDKLSSLLKVKTMESHKNAEGSSFVKKLFKGECSHESYVLYLWSLKEIYFTLEKVLSDHKEHQYIAPIYYKNLFRYESLVKDLSLWGFDELSVTIPQALSESVENYKNRLKELAKKSPELLVAHSYVRYLGDLSGGQILNKVLRKNFKKDVGFNFYEFPFSNTKEMKTEYREKLDKIGEFSEQNRAKISDEANYAFDLNSGVFSSLDGVLQ